MSEDLKQSPSQNPYLDWILSVVPAAIKENILDALKVKEQPATMSAMAGATATPPGFPPNIPVQQVTFTNWSLALNVPNVWEATPNNAVDVVTLANWAKDSGYRIRAIGHSHNWSPLVLPNNTDTQNVLLVNTAQLSGLVTFDQTSLTATFGTGTTIQEATRILQDMDNHGASTAPGYSWQNFTGPGALSLGGVLAIDAHGTSLPFDGHPQPLGGTMSNLVVSFKAVVTDPNGATPDVYTLKEFHRGDADADVFLTHLGRAFLTEVTMKVIPNYYVELKDWYPRAEVLFQAPTTSPANESISRFLDKYGRVEVIWFPFTDEPWVKTWGLIPALTQKPVTEPYLPFQWANSIPETLSNLIKGTLQATPWTTPVFAKSNLWIAQQSMKPETIYQGTSRNLLLYVEDSTLRVTAMGYAIQLRRNQVQEAASLFTQQFQKLLKKYEDDKGWGHLLGKYPINGPVELRWTTIDFAEELNIPGSKPPALSACHSVNPSDKTLDTVFWADILTLPGTEYSNDFYVEMEQWMLTQWGTAVSNVMRPEWSKGWAYTTNNGAWTNTQMLQTTIPGEYNQPPTPVTDSFTRAQQTLARYDKHHIYTNAFLDILLPG